MTQQTQSDPADPVPVIKYTPTTAPTLMCNFEVTDELTSLYQNAQNNSANWLTYVAEKNSIAAIPYPLNDNGTPVSPWSLKTYSLTHIFSLPRCCHNATVRIWKVSAEGEFKGKWAAGCLRFPIVGHCKVFFCISDMLELPEGVVKFDYYPTKENVTPSATPTHTPLSPPPPNQQALARSTTPSTPTPNHKKSATIVSSPPPEVLRFPLAPQAPLGKASSFSHPSSSRTTPSSASSSSVRMNVPHLGSRSSVLSAMLTPDGIPKKDFKNAVVSCSVCENFVARDLYDDHNCQG